METTTTTTSESAESNPPAPTVVVPIVTPSSPPESTETLVNLAQQIERNQAEFQTMMTTFRSEMADIRNLASEALAKASSLELAAVEVEEESGTVEVEPTPLPTTPEAPAAQPKSKRHPVLAVFLGRLP